MSQYIAIAVKNDDRTISILDGGDDREKLTLTSKVKANGWPFAVFDISDGNSMARWFWEEGLTREEAADAVRKIGRTLLELMSYDPKRLAE